MTEQEKLARQWAERVMTTTLERIDPVQRAAAEYILDTVPPATMADVEWNDEKHLGAGATDTNGRVWVMSQDDGGYINCIGLDMRTCGAPAEDLTPNGKRYELVEVLEPEHPEVLVTVEDYENAPVGTIVATPGEESRAVQKLDSAKWGISGIKQLIDAEDCHRASADYGATTVLRWGWGDEA